MATPIHKICTKCEVEKAIEAFPLRKSRGKYQSICQSCVNVRGNRWKKENPEKARLANNKSARIRHERVKKYVFAQYGGVCVCCKESDLHFLTLDHIDGTVPENHRQPDGRRLSGTAFLYRLIKEEFPDTIRVLCWNCNESYGYYGFCPHQPHELEQRRYS